MINVHKGLNIFKQCRVNMILRLERMTFLLLVHIADGPLVKQSGHHWSNLMISMF